FLEHWGNWARKRRLVFLLLGLLIGTMARAEEADLVLTNGNVYTVNDRQSLAQAIAAKDGRVVFVGSSDQAKKCRAAKVIGLDGRTVAPGFTDSYCRISGMGEREMK